MKKDEIEIHLENSRVYILEYLNTVNSASASDININTKVPNIDKHFPSCLEQLDKDELIEFENGYFKITNKGKKWLSDEKTIN